MTDVERLAALLDSLLPRMAFIQYGEYGYGPDWDVDAYYARVADEMALAGVTFRAGVSPSTGDAERLEWFERDLLRGTEAPAQWGVPPDYANGYIAGVRAFRERLADPVSPSTGDAASTCAEWCVSQAAGSHAPHGSPSTGDDRLRAPITLSYLHAMEAHLKAIHPVELVCNGSPECVEKYGMPAWAALSTGAPDTEEQP